MLSTFHGIEVGRKGLMANTMGMDTTGHNLSNIDTEGYSRQKVNLRTTGALYEPSANRVEVPGQIGSGVEVEDIQRVRDQAIDDRMMYEKNGQGFWQMKKEYLHQIEMIQNEPGSDNLRTALDNYWESWQKVASDPTERASREELIQRTQVLTDAFQHNFRSLTDLRQNADGLVQQRVDEINNSANEIATLNIQIVKSEAMGDKPNDLYDRRDLFIDRLSKITDIRVERNNKHEAIVYIGSENLVQGGTVNEVQGIGNPQNDGYVDIKWMDGRSVKLGANGELAGLLSVRDEDIKQAVDGIDSLAQNIVDSTNEVHRDGFGLNLTTNNNFFKEMPLSPYSNGNYDFNNDGTPDGSALFKVSGTQKVDMTTVIGSAGFINLGLDKPGGKDVIIAYKASDKVNEVIDRINQSDAGAVAYLNQRGEFTLKAKFPQDNRFPDFVLRHVEDSGNFLVGITGVLNQSGGQGAFDYKTIDQVEKFNVPAFNVSLSPERHPSGWMALDDKIKANPDTIAAAGATDTTGDGKPDKMNGIGDNQTALAVAGLRNKKVMVESQSTFGDFSKAMIGDFGTRSESAKTNYDKNTAVIDNLENLRKQVSGVNVDEEMTKMIMYQHGYNAAARLVTTVDNMIQTLIRMGA